MKGARLNRKVLLLFVGLLAGCTSLADYSRRARQANYQTHINSLAAQCASYGFPQNTSEFSNCMLQTDQSQHQQAAADQQRRDSGRLHIS